MYFGASVLLTCVSKGHDYVHNYVNIIKIMYT